MIFFLSTRGNRHPVDQYLASWGVDYRELIQPVTYDILFRSSRIRPGVYFFGDLELMTERELDRAGEIRERLDRSGEEFVGVNHPLEALGRYQLLTMLHETGINDFSVCRPGDDLRNFRYPVFLRLEKDHEGARGGMLAGPEELSSALATTVPASGHRPEEWLITEFCDTSGPDGIFRKYSAFLLQGRVIPRHVFFGVGWSQKRADLLHPELLAEEEEYVRTNPHEDRIREIFGLAGIEYGRIDYGLRGGRMQVWEINTNPMILSFDSARPGPRLPVHRRFADALHGGWERIGSSPAGRSRENYPRQRLVAALHRYRETPGKAPFGKWLARKVTARLNPRPPV